MTSILQLEQQVPQPWARLSRAGEAGSFSYTLDGSGLDVYNRLMHRDLIPVTSDVSFQIRIRCQSSLVTSNPAYEGLAPRMRGFSLQGQQPATDQLQVWDSNPSGAGKSMWVSEQNSEFTTYSFIINVPSDKGIDYVSLELVCRAASGQVIISNVECRYYYGRIYPLPILGQQRFESAALTIESMDTDFDGIGDVRRWVRYLLTEDISCRTGQNMIFTVNNALINGIATQFQNGVDVATRPSACTRGFTAKLKRKGIGQYDYVDLAGSYTGEQYNAVLLNETRSFRARYDYEQVEVLSYIDPHPNFTADTIGALFIEHKNVDLDLIVADFVAPSQ